jgi:hypothetical protein
VIGLPHANGGVGAVEIAFHNGKRVVYRPGTHGISAMAAGAHFGAVAEAVDANGDGCDDLLVGAPGLRVDGMRGGGGLVVLIGGHHGLAGGPLIVQGGLEAPGIPEANAHFGASIIDDGGFDDGGADVRVGVPGASVAGLGKAGEVVEFEVDAQGNAEPARAGLPITTMRSPQAGARFGSVIDGRDIVTAPGASHGAKRGTGYFEVDGVGFFGHEAGEHLGTSFATSPADRDADDVSSLYFGAPDATVHSHLRAGAVERYDWDPDSGTPSYVETLTAGTAGVPGAPTTGARFGAALTGTWFEHGAKLNADLIIGVPGMTVHGVDRAGGIEIEHFAPNKHFGFSPSGWNRVTQASRGVPGTPARRAYFGAALSAEKVRHRDDATNDAPTRLVVGIPGAHPRGLRGAGAAELLQLKTPGSRGTDVELLHREHGPRRGDAFGAWVG